MKLFKDRGPSQEQLDTLENKYEIDNRCRKGTHMRHKDNTRKVVARTKRNSEAMQR